MNKIIPPSLIPSMIILCLVIGLSGTASAYQMSERSYDLVSDCYTDHLIAGYGNVPEYRPDGTVTTTGIIATIPDEKAMWDWRYEMKQITNTTRTDMKNYYFPDGPVISYGSDLLGTICVGIWKEADTTKKTRDDIYHIIDTAAHEKGIDDVAVIFISESIFDTRPLPVPDPDETQLQARLRSIADAYAGSAAVPVFGHHITLALPSEPGFPIHYTR